MATLISTPQDLYNIRNNTSDDYELANDIDMSNFENWTAINSFNGSFNGKGHVIKNLTYNSTIPSLFVQLGSGGLIENLGVVDANLVSNSDRSIGILIGEMAISASINNCFSTGYIKSSYVAGGLVGYMRGSSNEIRNCYSHAEVEAETAGGLVGWQEDGDILYSYATGKLNGSVRVGGVVSFVNNSNNSYTYWDTQTTGTTDSKDSGSVGKTTSEMQTLSTYTNWDFDTVWGIDGDYPYLQVFGAPVIPPKQESREISSYLNEIHSHVDVEISRPPVTENVEVNSYIRPIEGNVQASVSVSRNVDSYTSPIHSNVTTSVSSPDTDNRNVTSFMNTINSNVVIEVIRAPVQVTRNVTSHVRQLQASADVSIYVEPIPILATVSVIHNRSMAYHKQNMSNSITIENPSYVEVVK